MTVSLVGSPQATTPGAMLSASQVAEFDAQGVVVFDGGLAPELVDALEKLLGAQDIKTFAFERGTEAAAPLRPCPSCTPPVTAPYQSPRMFNALSAFRGVSVCAECR